MPPSLHILRPAAPPPIPVPASTQTYIYVTRPHMHAHSRTHMPYPAHRTCGPASRSGPTGATDPKKSVRCTASAWRPRPTSRSAWCDSIKSGLHAGGMGSQAAAPWQSLPAVQGSHGPEAKARFLGGPCIDRHASFMDGTEPHAHQHQRAPERLEQVRQHGRRADAHALEERERQIREAVDERQPDRGVGLERQRLFVCRGHASSTAVLPGDDACNEPFAQCSRAPRAACAAAARVLHSARNHGRCAVKHPRFRCPGGHPQRPMWQNKCFLPPSARPVASRRGCAPFPHPAPPLRLQASVMTLGAVTRCSSVAAWQVSTMTIISRYLCGGTPAPAGDSGGAVTNTAFAAGVGAAAGHAAHALAARRALLGGQRCRSSRAEGHVPAPRQAG